MDYKRANRAFLYSTISTLAFVLLFSLWQATSGRTISVVMNNFLSEMVVLVPVIATVLYAGEKLSVVIPLKRIKISSVLMTVLYVLCLYPLITLVNAVSMLFVDNEIAGMVGDITAEPMWLMLLSIGIFGPFVEEIIFRGVILQSFQRTGRIIGSMIISSLMFGMMHMNFNQFAYGAVMGFMLSLLVEATGSVISSFIAHGIFNSIEVILMYAASDTIENAEEILGELGYKNTVLLSIGIYFVLAVIFTALALCVVYRISDLEGRKEFFSSIPRCKKQGYKLITFSWILATVLSFAYMTWITVMLKILS
ncbi:MAG: CPBP family intramembrane metalloprotease [Butyrivibrio sp.]|nr:CPBP family intramembrane metalloprotease [Butyrivibrio sp.]